MNDEIVSTMFMLLGSGIMIWILAKVFGFLFTSIAVIGSFITSCTEVNRAKAQYYKEEK